MKDSEAKNGVSRRFFISGIPPVAATLLVANDGAAGPAPAALTAGDVHNYLKSLDGGWVDWNKSVDTFKSGTPEAVVKGIAVGWMSYTGALKKALELGCNLFVTHEPTYYNHRDNDPAYIPLSGGKSKAGVHREKRPRDHPLP